MTCDPINRLDIISEEESNNLTEKVGHVSECIKLNVRSAPSFSAEVITTIPFMTQVVVEEVNPYSDWYKIITAAGIEGYCIKKYILLE